MITQYEEMKNFKAIYEKDGAYHESAKGFWAWFLKDNYMAIAKECRTDDKVLDLACGEGCLCMYLDVQLLVGVDYSEQALRLNRKLHPDGYDQLYLGDLRHLNKLSLPRPFCDVVVCSLSLMYLLEQDLRKCLREVYNFLFPGGRFIVTYPTVGPHRKGSPEAAELRPNDLVERLCEAGFELDKLEPICPLVPKSVLERSIERETEKIAFDEYISAKKGITIETSYHFLCSVRKNEHDAARQ